MSAKKKLYKIEVQHVAPKDEHTSIECFLLAENDEAVYHWVDKEKRWGSWSDSENDGHILDIYDEDYKIIGTETFKEKMIRIKGDINDDDQDWSDAYYGLTFYGWELLEENPNSILINALRNTKTLFESGKSNDTDNTIITENRVDVEDILKYEKQRSKCNKKDLSEIEFYKNGVKFDISQKDIDDFKFMGLNNTDFILSRDWDNDEMI